MKLKILASAFIISGTLSYAETHNLNADLTMTCNANGVVVDVNEGAYSGTTYYLGNSCDAARAGGGEGRWWFAASGWIVEIEGQGVRFNNEIMCEVSYCRP